jgi:uncharacterized membrane protein
VATYLADWLALLLRWVHVTVGIAWIGASFYFLWLDNHLKALVDTEGVEPEVAGELWAVHGGGFYRSRKYRVAPARLPPTLHWFYWEAYSTWLSGFALLCLLYFVRAEAYLIDPAVAVLSREAAVAIAIGALLLSWAVYDGLCRSPLARHGVLLMSTLVVLLSALAFGLCHVFSGRGAFMIFGASLGTIMVANVAMVIIPGQRELVRAKQQGRAVDPAPGLRGKQRSVHNTYFTLPVLFVMISNHYAMTYGSHYNWLVLIGLSFAGACVRAWFVARHRLEHPRGLRPVMPAAAALLTLATLIYVMAPASTPAIAAITPAATSSATAAVDDTHAQRIVEQRCVPCHAEHPSEAGFSAPPNGLVFQTLAQLAAHAPEVRQQLTMRTMPLGNLTQMSEEERIVLLQWIGRQPH